MKGVVRPQHAPTMRKPTTQRHIDGEDTGSEGVSESMISSSKTRNDEFDDSKSEMSLCFWSEDTCSKLQAACPEMLGTFVISLS